MNNPILKIVMMPLLMVKWCCLGFFFTMWFFISCVVTGITFVSYGVYRVVKVIAGIVGKIIIYPSLLIYKIISFPFRAISGTSGKSAEQIQAQKEQRKVEQAQKLEAKKLEKAKALQEKHARIEKEKAEKARITEEREKLKKRSNESYFNENAKREKKTMG